MRLPLILTPLVLFACKQEGALTPPPTETKAQAASQPAKDGAPDKAENPHDSFDKGPPGQPVSGLVKLADGLTKDDVKPTDVLFIMARESQGGGKFGRLVAVQRHGASEYPKRYELSAKDVMVPGIPFSGPFIVMARLDRDGDPMTRKPEDLYAVAKGEIMAGQEGVHLVLSKGEVTDNTPPEAGEPEQKAASQPMKKAASQPMKKAASQPN